MRTCYHDRSQPCYGSQEPASAMDWIVRKRNAEGHPLCTNFAAMAIGGVRGVVRYQNENRNDRNVGACPASAENPEKTLARSSMRLFREKPRPSVGPPAPDSDSNT